MKDLRGFYNISEDEIILDVTGNDDIQELITEYKNKIAEKEQTVDEDARAEISTEIGELLDRIPESIKNADVLYVMLYLPTGLPYIDDKDHIGIFSKREYAEKALGYFGSLLFGIEIVHKDDFVRYFGTAFYLYGAKGVLVDNGANYCYIDSGKLVDYHGFLDLISSPVPTKNPDFMLALEKFQQEKSVMDFEGKKEREEKVRKAFKKAFRKARFIVPLIIEGDHEPVYENNGRLNFFSEANRDLNFRLPSCTNSDGREGIPIFTDYVNFEKMYSNSNYKILTAKAELLLNWEFPCIIINSGLMLIPYEAAKGLVTREEGNNGK